jgi:hypothetical protein
MARLNTNDKKLLKENEQSFLEDMKKSLKKHKLHTLNLNMRFKSLAMKFDADCDKVFVTDGLGSQCWKCIGDTSPCP